MNAKQKPKIELFFSGLNEKYRQNKDYFQQLSWTVRSGRKEYRGNAVEENGRFLYRFAGNQNYDSFSALLSAVLEMIITYDSAVVEYAERGGGTRILMDDKNVRLEKFETQAEQVQTFGLKEKEYHLNLAKASSLLRRLGFLTDDGKLKNDMIRKYNQTDRFWDLIGNMFDGQNHVRIVDCACGKSYLSFILNYYLWEERHIKADFTGIDIKENVIRDSQQIAQDLGYRNMHFICEDLRTYDGPRPDAVISLHACDTATDMALGFAIRHQARHIICVPCCHKELLDQYQKPDLEPILKHGVFHSRMNDILTDGLRCLKLEACGYQVSCVEYCSPLDTPKNLLIRAEKTADKNEAAEAEYRRLLREWHVRPSIEYYSVKSEQI